METQTILIGLVILAVSIFLELGIYASKNIWAKKRVVAAIAVVLMAFGAGIVAATSPWALGLVFVIISMYRGFSLLRLIEGRGEQLRLKNVSRQSFAWLAAAQLLILVLIATATPSSAAVFQYLCVATSLVLAVLFATGTILNLLSTKQQQGQILSDKELPTVTIAIPARNETDTLAACLEAALASDYPKLEILVLDDCSQDKTAEVIKSFAHDGVRFVLGKVAPEDWLAKNYAYEQLLQQASGQYILFMGVDIRLHSTSVRNLVQVAITHNKKMISVLPRRTKSGLGAAFVQPMRYFWELAIPRKLKKWPPVLSSCWLIERKAAKQVGGFAAVTRAVLPERHFAAALGASYLFTRTQNESLITTHKDFSSQWSTAIRTRYPQLHRKPELVALQTVLFSVGLLGPFILLFSAQNKAIFAASVLCALILTATHIVITAFTNRDALWLSPINFFFAVLLDLAALNISMYLYEFREVYWKGRNVCVPVMRVVPKLPELENRK